MAYLEMDVYQLADIFENFRTLSLERDNIDPVYYPTLPSMSWDLAFKFTHTEVDLLKEEDMYNFFTKGIRGGMTFINDHHLVANSPNIPNTYDANLPIKELLYIDANNLYGHALSMKLPKSNFTWINEQEKIEFKNDINSMNLDGDVGYCVEVDLSYPTELQDKTVDLPLAPERGDINDDMLTEHMKDQWGDVCEQRFGGSKLYRGGSKLLLTHWDKKKYVIHAKLLQFYLKLGMRLEKVHAGIKFHQEAFFEPYISSNSKYRQEATDSFTKDFFKLKNNALFGKTMENVRKRKNFRLINTEEKALTLASRAEFMESYIFNEDLSAVLLAREMVVLNKPIYIGQAVLDLSKLVMYKLRYEQFPKYEKQFNGTIRIAGGDTDSFFLAINNIDLKNQLLPKMIHDRLLDTSNYQQHHELYSTALKAKLGCIKDEACGESFSEWVLLRPKCYAMKKLSGEEKKTAKGVQRAIVKNNISFADYRQAYLQHSEFSHTQRRFSSKHHQISTVTFSKRSLSFFEDKRAWISANKSLPYGNHLLNEKRCDRKRQSIAPMALFPESEKIPRLDMASV